jgi:hypothetical protein
MCKRPTKLTNRHRPRKIDMAKAVVEVVFQATTPVSNTAPKLMATFKNPPDLLVFSMSG